MGFGRWPLRLTRDKFKTNTLTVNQNNFYEMIYDIDTVFQGTNYI